MKTYLTEGGYFGMMNRILTLLILLVCMPFIASAQATAPNAAELFHEIKKLNVLGNALYLAAHPDDENQRIISYLSNERGMHTTYLSLTRGDGGQNLIGTEIRELLGVIRTQELLSARSIDGGHQRFTRAVDFGYSKHPDETFSIWQKDAVMSDLIYAIRELKPDVIIHRFDHRSPGTTHGHHTGSAMLGMEAFDMAGDPSMYPEHLDEVSIWQPKRNFFNTSWWFYGSREKFAAADKTNLYKVDIGTYYPLLGKSNNEIAYAARSMHRCQGFGAILPRGSTDEWLEFLDGDSPTSKDDPLSGLDLSWSRVEGGDQIAQQVSTLIDQYDFNRPDASVPGLVELHQAVGQIKNEFWKERKQAQIQSIIIDALGLYVEARADRYYCTPGSMLSIELESTNRSSIPVSLSHVSGVGIDTMTTSILTPNAETIHSWEVSISNNADYSGSFWLRQKGDLGLYRVDDMKMRIMPEGDPAFSLDVRLNVEGVDFDLTVPVVYRWRDPAVGELYRPVEIIPAVSVTFAEEVIILSDNEPKAIDIIVEAGDGDIAPVVTLDLGEGWKIEPAELRVPLSVAGEKQTIRFMVTPPDGAADIQAQVSASWNDDLYSKSMYTLSYDHIKTQTVLMPAQARLVRLDIQTVGERIGYVMGAGDKVPEALRSIGYTVDLLSPEQLNAGDLASYDAVLVGVRAFNTIQAMKYKNSELWKYVENGGRVIVQYNTRHRLVTDEVGPYPIKLSRDRVTDEFAQVDAIDPNHRILNYPNKLNASDWENWVQERGLYFPSEWDDAYTPILRMSDPEMSQPTEGSLLVASYGKGTYIYTGLSLFRELPAGVPGAYRLLANLIAANNKK